MIILYTITNTFYTCFMVSLKFGCVLDVQNTFVAFKYSWILLLTITANCLFSLVPVVCVFCNIQLRILSFCLCYNELYHGIPSTSCWHLAFCSHPFRYKPSALNHAALYDHILEAILLQQYIWWQPRSTQALVVILLAEYDFGSYFKYVQLLSLGLLHKILKYNKLL